jgi:hypothetical protein
MQKILPFADRTLVVIDMQERFDAPKQIGLQSAVKAQIRLAMQNGWAIVFLECRGYGKTLDMFTALAADYQRKCTVIKDDDDGGNEVLGWANARNWPIDYFRVVGCNTLYCVRSTIMTLTNQRATIELWGPGVGGEERHGNNRNNVLSLQRPNIHVLGIAA